MGGSLNVDTSALRQHATAIGNAAALANQAADAGTQVTPGGWDNAYGVYCQAFPAAVRPVAQIAIDLMQQLAKQLSAAEAAMKTTANQYDQQEHETTGKFKGLLGEAGSLPAGPSVGGGARPASAVGGQGGEPIHVPRLPTDPPPVAPIPSLPDNDPERTIRGTLDV